MERFTILSRVILVFLLVYPLSHLQAGNGRIRGSIRAEASREPVAATVMVLGSRLGTAADASGTYELRELPPGRYTLKFSALGHASVLMRDVFVHPDQTVLLDVEMQQAPIDIGGVEVVARLPLVDRTRTWTHTTFFDDDVSRLPVRSVGEIAALAPSSFKGFVRGARTFETRTTVDGIDITDDLARWFAVVSNANLHPSGGRTFTQFESSQSATLNIPLEAVDQATLMAGMAAADFSSSTGGYVTYGLREGRGPLTGSVSARVSQLGGLRHLGPDIYNDAGAYLEQKAVLQTSSNPERRAFGSLCTWYPGKYGYGNRPDVQLSASLGGSLSDLVGVFLTAQWSDAHGRLPNEWTRAAGTSVKLNLYPSSGLRLQATLLGEDRGRLFGWKNRSYVDYFRYFLEGVPKWDGLSAAGALKLTHVVDDRWAYEILASVSTTMQRRGYCDTDGDGIPALGEEGEFLTFADTAQVNRYQSKAGSDVSRFFRQSGDGATLNQPGIGGLIVLGCPSIFYDEISTFRSMLKAHISLQPVPHHLVTLGAQAALTTIERVCRQGNNPAPFPNYKNYAEEVWKRSPHEYSVYLHDRMEYWSLIINAGIRADILDLSAADLANWYAPWVNTTDEHGGPVRSYVRGEEVPVRVFYSPRLGVSHPITDHAALYFSWSQMARPMPYSILYAKYAYNGTITNYPLVHVGQEPVRSTEYNFGIQWSPAEDLLCTVDLYAKDYANYFVTSNIHPGAPGVFLSSDRTVVPLVTSADFVFARGIETSVLARRVQLPWNLTLSGRLSYVFSYAKAGTSVPGTGRVYAGSSGDSAAFGGMIPFGDLDAASRVYYSVPGGYRTSNAGYDRKHRIVANLAVDLPWSMRLNALGTFASGFYYRIPQVELYVPVYREGPWNKRVDIRLEKGIWLGGPVRATLFIDLINAFNWVNVLAYNWSGDGAWELYGDPTGGPQRNRPVADEGATLVYDLPREVYFGLRLSF